LAVTTLTEAVDQGDVNRVAFIARTRAKYFVWLARWPSVRVNVPVVFPPAGIQAGELDAGNAAPVEVVPASWASQRAPAGTAAMVSVRACRVSPVTNAALTVGAVSPARVDPTSKSRNVGPTGVSLRWMICMYRIPPRTNVLGFGQLAILSFTTFPGCNTPFVVASIDR
jgi:hypothetical protein